MMKLKRLGLGAMAVAALLMAGGVGAQTASTSKDGDPLKTAASSLTTKVESTTTATATAATGTTATVTASSSGGRQNCNVKRANPKNCASPP